MADENSWYDPGPYENEQRAAAQFAEVARGMPGGSAHGGLSVLMDAVGRAGLMGKVTDYEIAALSAVALDAVPADKYVRAAQRPSSTSTD